MVWVNCVTKMLYFFFEWVSGEALFHSLEQGATWYGNEMLKNKYIYVKPVCIRLCFDRMKYRDVCVCVHCFISLQNKTKKKQQQFSSSSYSFSYWLYVRFPKSLLYGVAPENTWMSDDRWKENINQHLLYELNFRLHTLRLWRQRRRRWCVRICAKSNGVYVYFDCFARTTTAHGWNWIHTTRFEKKK